jgi:hypothetical protein
MLVFQQQKLAKTTACITSTKSESFSHAPNKQKFCQPIKKRSYWENVNKKQQTLSLCIPLFLLTLGQCFLPQNKNEGTVLV